MRICQTCGAQQHDWVRVCNRCNNSVAIRVRVNVQVGGRPQVYDMAWGPEVTLREGMAALMTKLGVSSVPPGVFFEAAGQPFSPVVTIYEVASVLGWPDPVVLTLMRENVRPAATPPADAPRPPQPVMPEPYRGPTSAGRTTILGGDPTKTAPPAEAPVTFRQAVQLSSIMDAFGQGGRGPGGLEAPAAKAGESAAGVPPREPTGTPVTAKTVIVPSLPAKPAVEKQREAAPQGPMTDTGLIRLARDAADRRKTMIVRDAEPVDDDEETTPAEQAKMEVEYRPAPPTPASRSQMRAAQPEAPTTLKEDKTSSSGIRRAMRLEEEERAKKKSSGTGRSAVLPAQPKAPDGAVPAAAPAAGTAAPPLSDSGLFDVRDAVAEGAAAKASTASASSRSRAAMPAANMQTAVLDTAPTVSSPVDRTVRRRASVRWYSRMNLQRMFPLIVLLAKSRIRQAVLEDVGHAVASKMVSVPESNPFVTVRPVLPGCFVFPPEQRVDISPDEVDVRFQVVPQLLGEIKDARIEIYHHDRLLVQIALETEVVTQTAARVASIAGVIWPFLSSAIKGDGTATAAQGPLMQWLGETVKQPYAVESGVLALLAGAFVFYLANRPRESSEEREFLGAAPMTLAELLAAGRLALSERRWDEAMSFFEDAVNVAPRDPIARAGLARARRFAESPQKSLETLAEALELEVVDAEVFYQLACSRAALGRKGESMAALRESVRRGLTEPGRMNSEADLTLLAGDAEFRRLAGAR